MGMNVRKDGDQFSSCTFLRAFGEVKSTFFCLTGNQTGSKVDVIGKKLGTGVKYCWNEMEIDKKYS